MSEKASSEKGFKVICVLAAVALYSNVLKVWFGPWATVVSDAAIVCALLSLLRYRWNPRHNSLLSYILISALLLVLLSAFEMLNENITNRLYSLIEFRKTFFQLLAFYVAYAFCSDTGDGEQVQRFIRFIALASIPLVLYGIKQFYLFDSFDVKLYSMMDSASDTSRYGLTVRAISFFSGPFHYGMFCALMLAMSLYLNAKTKNRKYLVLCALCLMGVFCSYTRTNMACSLVVIAVSVIISSNSKQKASEVFALRALLFAALLLIAGLLLFENVGNVNLGNGQLSSLINSILNAKSDTRLTNRFVTWDRAFELIALHPLLGNGMGSAGDTLSAYNVAINWVTPHNAFLKVAVELGIGGLLCFVLFLFSAMTICFQAEKGSIPGIALVVSVLSVVFANMMFGSTLGTFPVITLIYMLIGVSCKKYERSLSQVNSMRRK